MFDLLLGLRAGGHVKGLAPLEVFERHTVAAGKEHRHHSRAPRLAVRLGKLAALRGFDKVRGEADEDDTSARHLPSRYQAQRGLGHLPSRYQAQRGLSGGGGDSLLHQLGSLLRCREDEHLDWVAERLGLLDLLIQAAQTRVETLHKLHCLHDDGVQPVTRRLQAQYRPRRLRRDGRRRRCGDHFEGGHVAEQVDGGNTFFFHPKVDATRLPDHAHDKALKRPRGEARGIFSRGTQRQRLPACRHASGLRFGLRRQGAGHEILALIALPDHEVQALE